VLLAALAVAMVITPITIRNARAHVVPAVPTDAVSVPALPSSADLQSLLSLLPVAPDLKQLDLTKASQVNELLHSLPVDVFHPTFTLNDEPGSWMDTGFTITGGRSLAPMLKIPGVPTKATFVVGPDTGAETLHTVTSLIRPVGAAPFDQASGITGTREYTLTEPCLYAFTCKNHPYMLGAIVLDVDGRGRARLELRRRLLELGVDPDLTDARRLGLHVPRRQRLRLLEVGLEEAVEGGQERGRAVLLVREDRRRRIRRVPRGRRSG
jgi:hypothetical protein